MRFTRLKKTAALPISFALIDNLCFFILILSTVASMAEFTNSIMGTNKVEKINKTISIALFAI